MQRPVAEPLSQDAFQTVTDFHPMTPSHTAAQRIIQRSQHTLEVDEKKYRVTATEHRERLEPDQVRGAALLLSNV